MWPENSGMEPLQVFTLSVQPVHVHSIKLLLSLSVTLNLMVSVMDISDAFLQVAQKDFVVKAGLERL